MQRVDVMVSNECVGLPVRVCWEIEIVRALRRRKQSSRSFVVILVVSECHVMLLIQLSEVLECVDEQVARWQKV